MSDFCHVACARLAVRPVPATGATVFSATGASVFAGAAVTGSPTEASVFCSCLASSFAALSVSSRAPAIAARTATSGFGTSGDGSTWGASSGFVSACLDASGVFGASCISGPGARSGLSCATDVAIGASSTVTTPAAS